jgi:hypothetical protein
MSLSQRNNKADILLYAHCCTLTTVLELSCVKLYMAWSEVSGQINHKLCAQRTLSRLRAQTTITPVFNLTPRQHGARTLHTIDPIRDLELRGYLYSCIVHFSLQSCKAVQNLSQTQISVSHCVAGSI